MNPQVPFSYTVVFLFSAVLIDPWAKDVNDFCKYADLTSTYTLTKSLEYPSSISEPARYEESLARFSNGTVGITGISRSIATARSIKFRMRKSKD